MRTEVYDNDDDFFEQFEGGYFDSEQEADGMWRGYIADECGKMVLVAYYNFNTHEGTLTDAA